MAHMGCDCGNNMWDGDGKIVYHLYKVKDIIRYMKKQKVEKTFSEMYYEDYPLFCRNNPYFWLCDKCKNIHLWSDSPKYCYREYKIVEKNNKEDLSKIKELDEYIVVNLNDYEVMDDMLISDIIKKNPVRPYKYYVEDDLTRIYIINTNEDKIDRIYELVYEDFVKYKFTSKSIDNKNEHLLICTINKRKGQDIHTYKVENGKRKQVDSDDYPHRQVNFMITERSGKGSISFADPNREPEVYTSKNMNVFYEKYGKYFANNKKGKD